MIRHWILHRMGIVLDKCKENQNICLITFFQKWCSWDIVEKYGRARQAKDDNMVHCMQGNWGCIHSEYVILIAFTQQQWLLKTCLHVTLYAHSVINFDVLLTMHLGIFISVINQLDAQNFCFTVSLFHASTCFKLMCSSSGGQNCITQPLVSSHL